MALTDIAHQSILDHFLPGTLRQSVDATCGNGHDTLFLAQHTQHRVWAFDVQAKAISATRQRLEAAGFDHVQLVNDGHQQLANHVDGEVDCVMFNFGYLPSADKTLTTQAESSLLALNAALTKLSAHGVMTLLCYPGHPAGEAETLAIRAWLQQLPKDILINTHLSRNPSTSTPVLYVLNT
ncbi:tRNA (mnm(5)s(2)U34)-methyltransferase [Arenicella xantha]|uniref:Putative rRNA methylase n=1 Tax=Arenicella xantha TaxID=644221 RepID=A0A395JKV5_9GAMM|nr:class I SAM-dependent methyltransferase [Arenicella xantha]RBP49598.1 putative rRNA methylase [Arenicella xantha]